MQRVLFIINPKAGTGSKTAIHEQIERMAGQDIECEFLYWESPDMDIVDFIKQLIKQKNITVVAAVGGDGTVNKVISAIIDINIPLLIIPIGSGNGLARHLKIPLHLKHALDLLIHGKISNIDTASVNSKVFACTSGVGFDAHIGRLFAKAKKRGLKTYVKITVKELFSYVPKEYKLTINSNTITTQAFLITIANANQWGNDVQIAPDADIQDGLLNIVILKPFKLHQLPFIAIKIFTKKIHHSNYVSIHKANEVLIQRENEGSIHYDGEPEKAGTTLHYKVNTKGLKVFVPTK